MSKRLLLCSGSLEGGGSERQIWQLANCVDRERFAPQVYLHHRRGTYLKRLESDVVVHDFWGDHAGRHFGVGLTHIAQVEHLASCIRTNRVDVVYDRTFHMTLVAAPACRKTATPRVSVIVSPPSRDFVQSRERFAALKKWLLGRAYRARDCQTICVSDDVADDAASFYRIPRERLRVIPSPIELQTIRTQATEGHEEKTGDFNLCIVGRLSREKGQGDAIRAFAEFLRKMESGHACLEIVGDGPDRFELEKLVADLGITEHVRFHGFLENPYPWIARADVLLVPSRYEGLPNVALEAMALKTPVLATRCSRSLDALLGTLQESAGVACGIRGTTVPIGDVTALSETLQLLACDPATFQSQSMHAFEYVNQHHAMGPWLEEMGNLFDDCIARRQRPSA